MINIINFSNIFQPNSQFSEDRLRKMAEERQQNMNDKFEEILKQPILITCPRVPKRTDYSSSASDLNVAPDTQDERAINSSNESCSSILLGYVNNRSNNLRADINNNERNGNNTHELMDLLRRINQQKLLLVQEIEKSKGEPNDVSTSNLAHVFKTVRGIEKAKNDILGVDGNKENQLENERKSIEEREQLLKMKEQKLEQRIQELYEKEQKQKELKSKRNIEIQSNGQKDEVVVETNDDSLGSSQVSYEEAPIKIIINVAGKGKKKAKSPRRVLLQKNQRHKMSMCSLSDIAGDIFPKTPTKKSIAKEIPSSKPVISIENTFDGSSTSTSYQNLPTSMQTDLTKVLKKQIIKNQTKENIKIKTPALEHYISRLLGMSRASIEQLGVSSVSSVDTPTSSIINTSANVSECNEAVHIIDEKRLNKLKKFIEDNHSFLNELEESLKVTNLSGTEEGNMKTVESVWMKTLQKQESEMKTLKSESKRLKELLKKKEFANRKKQHEMQTKQHQIEQQIQQPHLQQKQESQQVQQPIKPILKKPQSPKKVQVVDPSGIAADQPLLKQYEQITDNCSKRIADLTDMISKVRLEKQKLLEGTLSSMTSNTTNKDQNSTEYLDFVGVGKQNEEALKSNNSSQASGVQTLTSKEGGTTDNSPIKLVNSRPFGISRDSGISVMSRPLTSTDNRGETSPDPENEIPLMGIQTSMEDITTSGSSGKQQSQNYNYKVEYLNDGDVIRVERFSTDNSLVKHAQLKQRPAKPPTAITR